MPSIQPIKSVNVAGTVHPLDKTFTLLSGITTVAGSASSGSYKSVRWYVSGVEGVTAPYNGMKIAIKIPLAGAGTAGAVLSINGDTDSEYHPLAYNVNTVLTTHFPVNSIKVFIYDANQTMDAYLTSNTKKTITGVWKAESNYDSNTTLTYGTLAYYFRPYAAQTIYRYKFVMLDKDNRLVPLTTTNVSNGTAVTNQTPTDKAFRPEKIYWYNATGTINAGAEVAGNTLVSIGYNANNSTNGGMAVCNFNSTISAYRMIYLCGNYDKSTGLFTLRDGGTASSTNYYVQVPTNTANLNLSTYFNSSYDYILLGGTYSSNTYIHLMDNNPMYYFDGTNLIPYSATDTGATSIETTGTGNVVSSASYDTSTRKITLTKGVTALTSHQAIKTLKTDNTTAQTASSSEALNGSSTINLHKIAKTGTYSDLIGTPIPGDSGEIKTKYRCALKGYTGSGNPVWYYKLVKLPVDNSGNYASAIINGRIGGWTAGGMSSIYCLIWNRDGVGLALLDLGGTGTMSTIFDTADLVVYKNSDNTADIYIKCKGYFTFDLDVEVYQSTASITYDGTYITTTPSGTESGKASTSTSRLQLEKGVLKVNGTAVSLSTHNHDSVYVKYSAAQELTDDQKSQARTNIGAGTSNLAIGTTSTTAAAGNHTHSTTLATSTSTPSVTMVPDTAYRLSTGGTSVVFKTPSDAYKIMESLRKGSEADTAVGYYKIATINHYNWNFCDFCMLVKNSYAGVAYSTIFNCSCSDSNVDLRNFKLNIISGTDISDKLAYLYTYDSNNNLIKVEVFIHATRFEHPMCYIINARPGQQLVIPTQDEFNKATPDKPDGTTMTGYATYAIVSVGTSGQLLSSNGSSLVWTNDNRGLLHHDLTKEIENTTTDNGWSMFNDTYNGFLLKSLRFNANSPLWGIGDYGSGIVFGGGDTKGVISLSWRLAQIKFAGGNSGNGGPVWWIGLNGTSTTTYDLDKLRAKPDRVTGSKAYSQANLTSLYDLIETHKDIKFWTYKYTSGSQRTEMYSLMYNASYSGVLGTYSVNFYYINGGTVQELSSGTIYYEYFK